VKVDQFTKKGQYSSNSCGGSMAADRELDTSLLKALSPFRSYCGTL